MPRHVEKKSCDSSFSEVVDALDKLSARLGDEKPDTSAEVITICGEIVETLNMYHLTVIEEMAKIDVNPVVDMSKLDVINDRLLNIIQTLAMRKPKEWDFEIERDMMGEMINVHAKEVFH